MKTSTRKLLASLATIGVFNVAFFAVPLSSSDVPWVLVWLFAQVVLVLYAGIRYERERLEEVRRDAR